MNTNKRIIFSIYKKMNNSFFFFINLIRRDFNRDCWKHLDVWIELRIIINTNNWKFTSKIILNWIFILNTKNSNKYFFLKRIVIIYLVWHISYFLIIKFSFYFSLRNKKLKTNHINHILTWQNLIHLIIQKKKFDSLYS